MGCKNREDLKNTIDDVLGGVKKFIKDRETDSRIDQSIDVLWDAAFEGLELASAPVKAALRKLPTVDKNTIENNWWKITQAHKDASLIINNTRARRATLAEEAGAVKKWLSGFSKEDSRSLVQALNGDIESSALHGDLKSTYETLRNLIDTNADELVRLGVLDSKNKIEHYLKRYYKDYLDPEKGKGSSAAFSKFYKRKDLDHEARLALGMIEDASFVISNTLMEQKLLIEKALVLQQLADKFGSDVQKKGYVRISNDTSDGGTVKKWGALAGKWVPIDVKRELGYAQLVSDEMGDFQKILYPVVDFLKVTLTVKNPVTHGYNVGSNTLLAGLNGDLAAVGKVLLMRKTNPKKFNDLVEKANKHGLNSYLHELEEFSIDLAPDGKKVNIVKTIMNNIFMSGDSKTGKAVRKLYDWEDKIFKVASFYRLLEEGVPEAQAYKKAMEVYVDYTTPKPAALAVLDKSGLMPFLHYQYKATPATAKVMLHNPLRTVIMGTGVVALNMSAFQNDAEESFTSEWANDKLNLFGIQEWYEVSDGWFMNTGRMIPGTKFEFDLGGFVKGALNIVGGKTPLGYNINGKYDDNWDKIYKRGLVLAENYTPPLVTGRYGQRLVHIGLGELGLVEPKKNYYKEDMTVGELGLRALGVRKFNKKSEVNTALRSLAGQWGMDKISKEEMEEKLNIIITAAKKEGIQVDHRKLRTALKRARGKRNKKK